jgi:N,N'-diacetyllegionaminate synthase
MVDRTLIIAEAGVNHNGSMQTARQLVDIAAESGADIVKFQTFTADRLVIKRAQKASYQLETTGSAESQYEMLRRLELSQEMHEQLISHAKARGIEFMSTAFDEDNLMLLASMGLKRFKVPSGELTNLTYLRRIAVLASEVIISTGMARLDEIGLAIEVLEGAGLLREKVVVLHCTTEYPAPMQDVNLRAMRTIAQTYGVKIGYSDHTLGIEVAIAAVALGATVIEKHFTLDRTLPGPDHLASLEPNQLRDMIRGIRNIERAMGNGIKAPSASELRNLAIVRKSLVAIKPIKLGEQFTLNNIGAKRPGTGISPMYIDDVLGRSAPRDFFTDDFIEL